MCFIFLGKFYASFGEPEFILIMPCIPFAIFLSFENPLFDSLHLRETSKPETRNPKPLPPSLLH